MTELAVELEAWQKEPNDHGKIKAPGIPKQVMAVDAHWREKPRCMETIWGQAASSGMSGELRVMAKMEVEPAECEEYYKRCGVAGERVPMSEGRHHTPRPNTRRCTLGGICTKHGHSEAGGVDRNASGREGRALAAAADGGPTGARRRVAGENTCSGSGSAGGVATCWSESSVEIEAGDE